ncbi:MAG: porin [Gemmatimonadota bacterium]
MVRKRYWSLVAIPLVTGITSLAAQQPAAAPAPSPSANSPVKVSGYLQARETWQEKAGLTGSINRARVTLGGTVATHFLWRVQAEYRTGNVGNGKASAALQDAYIRYVKDAFGIQVGQFKTPFTREFITSLADLETADRATVVDSLAPKRDIGIMADWQFGKYATLTGSIFNGDGQNVTTNKDSTALGVARLVFKPVPQVAIGGNVARWFGDSVRYGVDAAYDDRRLALRAEYLVQTRDTLSGKGDRGWYGVAAVRVIRPVQLVGKYEYFNRPGVGPQQKNRAWTAGLNWFAVDPNLKLTFEYISRRVGDPGVRKGMVLGQVQARF